MLIFLAKLTAVGNHHRNSSTALVRTNLLDGRDNIHAANHLAENDVLAVKPGSIGRAEEELAAIGIRVVYGYDEMK